MIYTADDGTKVTIKVLGQNGPYRYIEMPDGTTHNVHWSSLSDPDTKRKPPRYIPNPEPYRTPKKQRGNVS